MLSSSSSGVIGLAMMVLFSSNRKREGVAKMLKSLAAWLLKAPST